MLTWAMTVKLSLDRLALGAGRPVTLAASGRPRCGARRLLHGMIDLRDTGGATVTTAVRLHVIGGKTSLRRPGVGRPHCGRFGSLGRRRDERKPGQHPWPQPASSVEGASSSFPIDSWSHLHERPAFFDAVTIVSDGKVCVIGSSSNGPWNLSGFWRIRRERMAAPTMPAKAGRRNQHLYRLWEALFVALGESVLPSPPPPLQPRLSQTCRTVSET